MDGLYVDNNFCVQIVVGNQTNANEWVVYHNDGDQDSIKLLQMQDNNVVLTVQDDVRIGAYNDKQEEIRWETGEVWHRLSISYNQWQLFTRRPYVPLTLMLLSILYDVYDVSKRFLGKFAKAPTNAPPKDAPTEDADHAPTEDASPKDAPTNKTSEEFHVQKSIKVC